jgi:HAD superfamily hydrolase (TIGR01509 family)
MSGNVPADIRVVLFDVGGVLVELGGVETMLGWLGPAVSADELWRRWLTSSSVRHFETGKIDAQAFAAGVIAEFALKLDTHRFLQAFAAWPTGLFPGTLEMLARIPPSYRRALLSNSNSLHWRRVTEDMGLGGAIETHFVSHLTGRIKPDTEAFEHAVESLGCLPEQVLFIDDNSLNIEAARQFGMHAVRARGNLETRRALGEFGVIEGER